MLPTELYLEIVKFLPKSCYSTIVFTSAKNAALIFSQIKKLPVAREIATQLLTNNWSVAYTLEFAAGINDEVVDLLIAQYTVEQLNVIPRLEFRTLPQDVKDKIDRKLDEI